MRISGFENYKILSQTDCFSKYMSPKNTYWLQVLSFTFYVNENQKQTLHIDVFW